MQLCNECAKLGRYSKTNLKIDLREIKHIIDTYKNIMASEYIELSLAKNKIIKMLMNSDLKCNCKN